MDELQKLLTPELYRKNPFRILNLPVTANARDVQRREARRQMEVNLGIAAGQTGGGPLALIPSPDEEQIKDALERLHDPTDRFLAELFWFWPSADQPDEALLALEQGKTDEAIRTWSAESAAGRRIAAQHNLTILHHMLALDDEFGLAKGTADSKQAARVQTLWPRALGHWHDVHANPEFRIAVTGRAAAINDVKVSQQLVSDVLNALPSAVLRINAQLAFEAAEREDSAGIRRHMNLLNGSRFEAQARSDAIRGALEPWEKRIRQQIESAKANWSRTPQRANQHVRTLHAACKRLLSTVDAVLSKGADGSGTSGADPYGPLRDALHDMAADAMRDGRLVFTQKVDDWDEAAKLTELALELATGGALRSRLTEDLPALRDNAKSGNDWCAPGYWDLPDATVAILEEARGLTRKGDFDGALAKLVPLDVSIGRPLRRAAAYCLSVSAIRIVNAGISEFNKEPATRERLWDKVAKDPSLIFRTPSPSTPSYLNPPCPLCGSRSYTRWSVFEMRGVPMWLCGTCTDRVRREIEDQRAALRREFSSALERMLLADELDPGEAGVTKNLQMLRKQAREIETVVPSTAALKARLDPKGNREAKVQVPYSLPSDQADNVCYFCRKNSPSPGCDISVPVCGDEQVVQRLLGRSTAIKIATVSIPRCQGCRDAHARRSRWEMDYKNAVRAADGSGVTRWLGKHAAIIGALICLAVGFAIRDGRAGIDVSAAFAAFAAITGQALPRPELELAERALPIACGLLAGGTVTAWLIGAARRRRVKKLELFLAEHPEYLPTGIEPESSYLDFPKLKDLLRQKWSFGHVYVPGRKEPVGVKGLAAATS
jgi:hypothetical protein